jgi:N-glycosylase/DNA lyase
MMNIINIELIKTPKDESTTREGLKKYWRQIKPLIDKRKKHFAALYEKATDNEIFAELAFCLFTPQSKALSCWRAVEILAQKDLLLNAEAPEIAASISGVRFLNNKSNFVVLARDFFTQSGKINIKKILNEKGSPQNLRQFLVANIKGIGYKEAGHFLRNIGKGDGLTILDRHILKNLVAYKVLEKLPPSLSPKVYVSIEKEMQNFSHEIGVPLDDLDMVLWCKESGGIFK